MKKQSNKVLEAEAMMRAMASVFGQKVYSFAVDYKLENGEDEHNVVQVLGVNGDAAIAARGIYDQLVAQGKMPHVIWHIPGDHSMDELYSMLGDYKAFQTFVPMYASDEIVREARAKKSN